MIKLPIFKVGVLAYLNDTSELGDPCIVFGIEGIRKYRQKYPDLNKERIAIQRIGTTNVRIKH